MTRSPICFQQKNKARFLTKYHTLGLGMYFRSSQINSKSAKKEFENRTEGIMKSS